VGSTLQLNNASKSKSLQGDVVVVVVEQGPIPKKVSHKSGHWLVHGNLPDNKQVPPKESDKHHSLVLLKM
jgi:hypothetical protein